MKLKTRADKVRAIAARYPRVIEWSKEDDAYVGSAPPLVGQCCHGADEADVAAQLAAVVEDLASDLLDGKMPEPVLPKGRKFSGKFVVRITPELHRRAVFQAMARGESLNQFVADALTHA